jgi:hypothetical protein
MFISGIVGSARKRAAEKKLQALAGNDESGPETPRE